jgi:hypothetical protein
MRTLALGTLLLATCTAASAVDMKPSSTLGQRVTQPAAPAQTVAPAQTPVPQAPTTVPASTLQKTGSPAAMRTPATPTAVPPAAPPASPVATPSSTTLPAATQAPVARRAGTTEKLAGPKQVKYLPTRTTELQSQTTLRDAENALAQNSQKSGSTAQHGVLVATGAAPLSASATTASMRMTAVPAGGAATVVPPAARPKVDTPAGVLNSPPGIWFVNDKDQGFHLTPGGNVTVLGKGFGDSAGALNVQMQSGAQVTYQVSSWNDREIHALLPANVRGVPDQPAGLRVHTRDGKNYALDGGKFYATREEITVNTNLAQVIQFAGAAHWGVTLADNGRVDREEDGTLAHPDIDCKAPGTDYLYFKPLPYGFVVSGIGGWFGRTDTGDGDGLGGHGNHLFTPGYSFGDWTTGSIAVARDHSVQVPMIPVNWGVWRSHAGATATQYGSPDLCSSNYQVEVSLIGPAGMKPF